MHNFYLREMSVTSIALKVETWLLATWHVKVPLMWLEACINWIQEENDNVNLSQAQLNKQVFEQWLLTDLRDLEHPLLPDGILEVPKGELNGFFALQINSLVDVSQPAYSQIQKLRGKNTTNDLITAETQVTQKHWEAKPSRLLMLQLTDGIVQMQGMEYQSIPALNSDLPPGTKILIYGNISFRLGVLLLKPENVKVLGGEVDSLLEEYAQEKVLARLIGEPDPVASVTPSNSNQSISRITDALDPALGPSDEELLASLDESDELAANNDTSLERRCFSTGSSSNTVPTRQSSFEPGLIISTRPKEKPPNQSMHFIAGELDDFSLEEALLLEESVQKEQTETKELQPLTLNRTTDESIERFSHKPNTPNNFSLICKNGNSNWNEKNLCEQMTNEDKSFSCPSARDQNSSVFSIHHKVPLPHDFTNKDKNSETDNKVKQTISNSDGHSLNNKILNGELVSYVPKKSSQISDESDHHLQTHSLRSSENNTNLSIAMDWYSPPFVYLSVLMASKPKEVTTVTVKAFIVTLTGNLSASGGIWSITAKISDGTAYLDVDFVDEILTSLIGYSVPEMKQLKKDPLQYRKFLEGLQKCQRDLIDLCCLMTISFNPTLSKAMVLALQDVNMEHFENLKKRLNK
ncbi:recQ-mediated genome instability protein 1 [Diceros bicornis minor]|uniref:recQ-mediated genome instability protein 1 n=1 Tax=Diceros bicornis minor TaxID=77932 RepID=UPI0026F2ABDE|nr:recQ-mediated genome instability protein 1 [Diceros bicornis minor]XP_058421519.1 recQ-mediated genome instability protein 1 [Diceros bicornis minor]XP_058421520.1 recQ-mediated genome instability protein 1 [Diceros bicornis minor]XP_058421521.1 recQ-mediated genome instability protein 1 [Diceros bicornis minor]XP_058421523.1 recQ-mediated genome instability protein 1 [Diceros bicornis minor]XP_058421524.1 recQ-mediated genome instability protein 1 [Diceros bicornis minor]XP_058421525.1 re